MLGREPVREPRGWRPAWHARRDYHGHAIGAEGRVFKDRIVPRRYIFDAAAATRHLLEDQCRRGIYHCVNSGSGTWRDVAGKRRGSSGSSRGSSTGDA